VTAATRLPQLTFVLDHLGNPDMSPGASPAASGPWAGAVTRFAARPNTIAKLSGILGVPAPPGAAPGTGPPGAVSHIRPYYDFVLSKFGPSRLMFGSDWPPCTLGCQLRPGLRGGPVPHRRAQQLRAGSDLLPHRAPHLPAALTPG
jgi:Predicted metal-dependent hydrolase of the TIM-barrel fold